MFLAGIILVILGLVFFLQNTGFLPYDTWNNLWPIIIVFIGLALMFARRGYYGLRDREQMGADNWGRYGEDRGMGGAESRAYGHGKDEEKRKERMHDKREDEM